MKRLEKLGFGNYIIKKGLRLNKKAIAIVEKDIYTKKLLEVRI